jgi:hypothetical protein
MTAPSIDLLNVSLTKHGAAKVALLLRKHPAKDVLAFTAGQEPGINIDVAQTKKNLSVGEDGKVPDVWEKVRALGSRAIDGLVLVGIIFSHHELIAAMAKARTAPFVGRLIQGDVLTGKAYTNFAYALEELNFSVTHTPEEVAFDLGALFEIEGLGLLVQELLTLKLRTAGWDETGDSVELMTQHGFHKALAISESQFSSWLKTGSLAAAALTAKDSAFFEGFDEAPVTVDFVFTCGHRPKKTGKVRVTASAADREAELLHNELQTTLYKQLVDVYGEGAVGTENPTGLGTTIDVVLCNGEKYWFYEIKVAATLRACLRQGIPQLLEYAYWRCDDIRIEKLIVVGTFAPDAASEQYLNLLRVRFNIPIYYEQLCPQSP